MLGAGAMAALISSTTIDGVVIVDLTAHTDPRGSFTETYRRSWFPDSREMVQSNCAWRTAGSVVGLHYHLHQADYWHVVSGHARVVLHDLRVGSATDGATVSMDLGQVPRGADHHLGLYIPPGVAHGLAAVTDLTLVYLVDAYYDATDELGVAWDDPDIGGDWAISAPVLSERDRANPRRRDLAVDRRPHAPSQA